MRTGNMLIDESETKKPVAHNPLEQFILLAKGTKGAACQDLIKTVLEAPGVYVFSELLEHPNIREVSTVVDDSLNYSWKIVGNQFIRCVFGHLQLENTPHANYLNSLNLFAYGTYRQYLENQSSLIELTEVMKKKLKHLTIVTMAINNKCIAYSDLLEQLDIGCVRELEDLIIESIYAGLYCTHSQNVSIHILRNTFLLIWLFSFL